MTVFRTGPTQANAILGATTQPKLYTDQIAVELTALFGHTAFWLTSVAGTNTITATTDVSTGNAYTALTRGMQFWLIPANDTTGAVTINIDSLGAKSINDMDANALGDRALFASRLYLIVYDGTNFRVTASRVKLLQNLTLYVRIDGSNSNTGFVNNAGGALLTLVGAYNRIVTLYDLNGFTVTVIVGAGTYTAGLPVSVPWIGGGSIVFHGDTTTPANVHISTTNADCFRVTCPLPGVLTVQGFKLQTTTDGIGINHLGVGVINFDRMAFHSCALAHMACAAAGAQIMVGSQFGNSGSYSITGGAGYHMLLSSNAWIRCVLAAITVSGTPAFGGFGFVWCTRNSVLDISGGTTITGAATGARFLVEKNALIDTGGKDKTIFFPGSLVGVEATGGRWT